MIKELVFDKIYKKPIIDFALNEPGGVISFKDAKIVCSDPYNKRYCVAGTTGIPEYMSYKLNVWKVLKKFFVHADGENSRGLYVLKFKLYPHESNDILYKKPEDCNIKNGYGDETYMCDSCLKMQPVYFGADDDYPEVCDDCWCVIEENNS